jgi:hypothetical protein
VIFPIAWHAWLWKHHSVMVTQHLRGDLAVLVSPLFLRGERMAYRTDREGG